MSTSLEIAMEKGGFTKVPDTVAAELISQQLSNLPESIQEAAKDGYIAGVNFKKKHEKFKCPHESGTKEYKFWYRAFGFGKMDAQ